MQFCLASLFGLSPLLIFNGAYSVCKISLQQALLKEKEGKS